MRRRTIAIAAAVAGVLCALAVVLAVLLFGEGGSVPAPAGEAVVYRASIEPERLLFGDTAVAELELTVNRSLVVPETVRAQPDFSPFQVLGPGEVTRKDVGETTILTYRYRLQCADRACVPGGAEAVFELPLSVFNYANPEFGAVTESIDWPELTVVSRLAPGEVDDPELELGARVPPSPSYGISPSLLGWGFAGLGAAIALAAGALAAGRVWRSVPERPEAAQPNLAGRPLERALAVVEASLEGAEEERRTALDQLARALDGEGQGDLAGRSRDLAWSRAAPGAAEARELADAARRLLGEAA